MIKQREVVSKARQKSKIMAHTCREQSMWKWRGNKIIALAPNGVPSPVYTPHGRRVRFLALDFKDIPLIP